MFQRFFSLLIGYVLGSFLTAVVVTKKYTGKDISEIGTGNPGMANVMAQIGRKAGIIVLLGDIAKTAFAMIISYALFGISIENYTCLWAGLGAIIGHNHPFWRKFRGGKGVAVTVTWLILLMPIYGTFVSVIGGIITIITGFLPLGAVIIAFGAIPGAFYFYGMEYGIVVSIAALLMLSRHYRGILRILRKEEERKFRK